MGLIVDIVSWLALIGGAVFYLIGAIGLNRMPDVFTRMHAVSVSETLGVGLMMLGMILQAGFALVTAKLVFIVLVLWTSGAVATHALARAALHDGERPLLADAEGRLVPTSPVELFPELRERLAAPLVSETAERAPADVPMGPRGPVAEDEAATTAPAPDAGPDGGPEAGPNERGGG